LPFSICDQAGEHVVSIATATMQATRDFIDLDSVSAQILSPSINSR
jgi:hypothetical protein